MNCKFISICPSATGLCENAKPSEECVEFLVSASELQKTKIKQLEKELHSCVSGEAYWVKCILDDRDEASTRYKNLINNLKDFLEKEENNNAN